MNITPQSVRGMYVAYNTLFNKALATQSPLYEQVATVVPSTAGSETYAWLGDIPGMREWIGDREVQNLSAEGYTIVNKSFELTVGVPRTDVEDDKLGLYNPSIQMMAQTAAMHPDKLVFALLKRGFSTKCYDGESFYSTRVLRGNHPAPVLLYHSRRNSSDHPWFQTCRFHFGVGGSFP